MKSPFKVLVIDDDEDIAGLIVDALSESDLQSITAADGMEAWEIIEKKNIKNIIR